jgi:hypothetical protein
MYFLVREYYLKSWLPPPFIICRHIWLTIKKTAQYLSRCVHKRSTEVAIDADISNNDKFFETLENACRSEYNMKQQDVEEDNTETNLSEKYVNERGNKHYCTRIWKYSSLYL